MKATATIRGVRKWTATRRQRDRDRVEEPQPHLVELAAAFIGAMKPYFRAEVHGLERLPNGPALLAANHNSGITSMEPFFLGHAEYRRTGELLYYLTHDALIDLPLVGDVLSRIGTIRATHEAAGRAFALGKKIVAFPGGNYEAFRPFSQRHRVDFAGRTGFVRLALRHRVPIVPVLCLGGHETLYVISRGQRLARALGIRKALRSDSFPLFLAAPWGLGVGPIFHLPLPAKLVVEVGEPISLADADESDPNLLGEIRDRVQDRLQEMMDRRSAERRWPILG